MARMTRSTDLAGDNQGKSKGFQSKQKARAKSAKDAPMDGKGKSGGPIDPKTLASMKQSLGGK